MILVVGGTGILGSRVVRGLRDRGEAVRVLTRSRDRAGALPEGTEIAIGDLRDRAACEAAVAGCDTIVSAAHGFVTGTTEAIDRDGNVTLFRAADAAGARRIVMVSVYGASAQHPMHLHRSKFAAEEVLRAGKVPYVILRPTSFLETWAGVIGDKLAERGEALVLGPGRNPINFVSADDVAALVIAAACGEVGAGEVMDIGGLDNLDFMTIANRLIAASGKPGKIKHVPLAALRMMSVLARPFSRGFAQRARAAVVMNTIDMTCAPHANARTRLDDVLTSSARTTGLPAAQTR